MADLHPLHPSSSPGSRQILPAPAPAADPYFIAETDAHPNLAGGGDFSSSGEQPTVSSRCSVRLFHDTISKFCPLKVELVRSIGFEGVLHIPLIKQINLKFSTWLMSRVDESSNSLVLSDGSFLEFNKHDVSRVFGIPAGGYSIDCNIANTHGPSSDAPGTGSSLDFSHSRSIKAAQNIVSRPFQCDMSSSEQDEFRAAFVVFVMSTVLAPSAKHDRVSDDYMHAILEPSNISSFDWSDYVIRRLIEAVRKLKQDIASNVKAPCIFGCSLFLQVLYLDSIDLGALSMPHDDFPRIKCFTAERIRAMIVADPLFNLHAYNIHLFHKPQLRAPGEVCYSWASSKRLHGRLSPQDSRLLSLWQCSLSMTRVLKIPPEAAGALFIAAAGCPDALKFMDLIFHLIEPYINGFTYRPSVSTKSRPFEFFSSRFPSGCVDPQCCSHLVSARAKRKRLQDNGECSNLGNMDSSSVALHHGLSMGRSPCNGMGSRMSVGKGIVDCLGGRHGTPVDAGIEDVDMQAISAMARFYLELSPVKPTRCSDLNLIPVQDETGSLFVRTECSRRDAVPRTPWQIGYTWSIDTAMSGDILNKLPQVDDTDDPWFAHFCPKYIEVSTRAVKEQVLGQSEFELEMFDAAIRRLKQIDDELYANEGSARWRHYVESDFMVCLVAGSLNIMDPVLRSHFCGRHIKYDVTGCRMFIFPVILQYCWACFVWRIEDNTIVVYDPCSLLALQPELPKIYARVVQMLKSAMLMVSSFLFDRWSYDWQSARIEVLKPGNEFRPRWNRSGLMCIHFCRFFDGSKVTPPLDIGQIDALSGMILGEVSALERNFGIVPNSIRQSACMGNSSRSKQWSLGEEAPFGS